MIGSDEVHVNETIKGVEQNNVRSSWLVANMIYDPSHASQVLGIKMSSSEKQIKLHFKNLSEIYHPNKVRETVNESLRGYFGLFHRDYKGIQSSTLPGLRTSFRS
ncbi:hypothetical protein D9758_014668 [Tetrapyrgos nigripes]|uniref:Uncharacterized protein n=1 Tax=Tetrapyrgos nigripes TaxID=182062 RepID=A0A8H5CW49_9AGAR|nr:hypothetical protein D9758_014668 [Tetrapyrgos nigripes]